MENLPTFALVVEHRSFSKVARVLKVSPSTISRQMDLLEHELGTKLFKRTTRQLIVTEAGLSFYSEVKRALQLLAAAKEKTKSRRALQQLSVNVFESFGSVVVIPAVLSVLRKYPNIDITVSYDSRISQVSQGEADLFIRLVKIADSSFTFKKICTNEFRLYASDAYLAAYGIPQSPDDLMDHNCLTLHRIDKRVMHFRQGKKKLAVTAKGNFASVSSLPLLQAAVAGLGIAILPTWLVSKDVKLVPVLENWQLSLPSLSDGFVHAVYPRELAGNQAIHALLHEIQCILSADARAKH